jgi:hypothetical protein
MSFFKRFPHLRGYEDKTLENSAHQEYLHNMWLIHLAGRINEEEFGEETLSVQGLFILERILEYDDERTYNLKKSIMSN